MSICTDKFTTNLSASVLFKDALSWWSYMASVIGQRMSRLRWWEDTDRGNRSARRKTGAIGTLTESAVETGPPRWRTGKISTAFYVWTKYVSLRKIIRFWMNRSRIPNNEPTGNWIHHQVSIIRNNSKICHIKKLKHLDYGFLECDAV